jgi:hypothetical protein
MDHCGWGIASLSAAPTRSISCMHTSFASTHARLRFRALLWAAIGAAALLSGCSHTAPTPKAAANGWATIEPGLLHQQLAPGVQALRLDLQASGLRLALSAPSEAGLAIDARPSATAAVAAFNASFFDRDFRVRGLTLSEGQAWPAPMSPLDSPLLACDAAQACEVHLQPPPALAEGTHTAVAGTPWLVRQGQPRSDEDDARCPGFCANQHPRTALGLSADRRYLFVLLAEGRRPGVPGLSLARTAALLQGLGAYEAFNLDGGGSSALLIRGQAAMQRPANEPAQRRVANVLLISAPPRP